MSEGLPTVHIGDAPLIDMDCNHTGSAPTRAHASGDGHASPPPHRSPPPNNKKPLACAWGCTPQKRSAADQAPAAVAAFECVRRAVRLTQRRRGGLLSARLVAAPLLVSTSAMIGNARRATRMAWMGGATGSLARFRRRFGSSRPAAPLFAGCSSDRRPRTRGRNQVASRPAGRPLRHICASSLA